MRISDWSSDVCSSDLKVVSLQSGDWEINKGNQVAASMLSEYPNIKALLAGNASMAVGAVSAIRAAGKAGKVQVVGYRSEEGRVGKECVSECRYRWWAYHEKQKRRINGRRLRRD